MHFRKAVTNVMLALAMFIFVCEDARGEEKAKSVYENALESIPELDRELYELVSPAVVQLVHGDSPRDQRPSDKKTAAGHGFYISSAGHIATSYHQVRRGHMLFVQERDGALQPVDLIYGNPIADVAILKADVQPEYVLSPCEASRAIREQAHVWLLRHPEDSRVGKIICGRILDIDQHDSFGRMLIARGFGERGDSGGPLVDRAGKLVSMNRGGNSLVDAARSNSHTVPADRVCDMLTRFGGQDGIWMGEVLADHDIKLWARVWGLDEPAEEAARAVYDMPLLSLAAAHGSEPMIKKILRGKPDVNEEDAHGLRPLDYAMARYIYDCAELLSDNGATAGDKRTLSMTPLHMAISAKDKGRLRSLLASGSNPNEADHKGLTPLMYAARLAQSDMARVLVQHGADLEAENEMGDTALFYAIAYGGVEMVEKLIDLGANENHLRRQERIPLECAASSGDLKCVKYFLDRGVNVNEQDSKGMTALYGAVYRRKHDVVKYLIDQGADVTIPAERGYTALMAAARSSDKDMVQMLVTHGADINRVTDDGWSVLALAAYQADVETIQLLIALGADCTAHRHTKLDPIQVAKRRVNEEGATIIRRLLDECMDRLRNDEAPAAPDAVSN